MENDCFQLRDTHEPGLYNKELLALYLAYSSSIYNLMRISCFRKIDLCLVMDVETFKAVHIFLYTSAED